jgi:hypothetical protein
MRFRRLYSILISLSFVSFAIGHAHAATAGSRCMDTLITNIQGPHPSRAKLGAFKVAKWVQEHRRYLGWSIETLAYKLWQFGYELSTNKIWRLEQNLVEDGKHPLTGIDYNFIVALEGVFERPILASSRPFVPRTNADFLSPLEVARWVQAERNKRGWSMEVLSRRLQEVDFETSQNMIYRLEQNLISNGRRPLQTIDYEFVRALRAIFND